MICDSICLEPGNIDKNIDYNLLLETPYYYSQYSSPTPSTPLSSPASSLILDDMTGYQHHQSLPLSSTSTTDSNSIAPTVPEQQPLQNAPGISHDWLLDPFYDVGSFSYQPLAISPAESDQLINAAVQSLNCPEFQQSMMMTELTEIPIGGLVSPPLSSRSTRENSGTNDNFTTLNQHFHSSDSHQHQHQYYKSYNQQHIYNITASSSTSSTSSASLSQTKPTEKAPSASSITARNLNIEYPTSSSSSNKAIPMVTPISSTTSSSVARPASRHKKIRQSPSNFQCDFPGCQKSFTRPYNLNSHRRTHTNEKPFDCPHCPKTFARQHDRNRHAKLHSGVKPFLCHFCSKSFARQDALSRHQLWSEDHKVIGCSILNRKNGKDSK